MGIDITRANLDNANKNGRSSSSNSTPPATTSPPPKRTSTASSHRPRRSTRRETSSNTPPPPSPATLTDNRARELRHHPDHETLTRYGPRPALADQAAVWDHAAATRQQAHTLELDPGDRQHPIARELAVAERELARAQRPIRELTRDPRPHHRARHQPLTCRPSAALRVGLRPITWTH